MIFFTQNRKYRNARRGFTVFELLVTVSVFVILSTFVVANFKTVNNSLILRNVANQVATVVRKAQVHGISVKGFGSGPAEVFPSYGVNFNRTAGNNTFFTLFADRNRNGIFDGTCPATLLNECVQRYNLPANYTISSLRGNQKSGTPGTPINPLNVTFTRPNPDACFKLVATATPCPTGSLYSDAEVFVRSPNGTIKTIIIWRTGQISVE